jgi:hypothetical protein
MDPEPQPVPVLEYQPESTTTWAPVVRICAWTAIALGAVYVIAFAAIGIWMLFGDARSAIGMAIPRAITGIPALGLLVGGIGALRYSEGCRRILLLSCAAFVVVGCVFGMLSLMISYQNMGGTGLFGGGAGLNGLIVANQITALAPVIGPGIVFLLLRRPEARRVFETRS